MIIIAKKVKLQVFEPLAQKWFNHHKKPYFNTVKDAENMAEKIRKDIKSYNKKAEKKLGKNVYGTMSIPNMRIVDTNGKKIPATQHDIIQNKKYKKYYQI